MLIGTDWGTSVRHSVTSDTSDGTTLDFLSSDVEISLSHDPAGGEIVHGVSGAFDELAYSQIYLHLTISGTFGTGTVSPELNLQNFLSIHNLIED